MVCAASALPAGAEDKLLRGLARTLAKVEGRPAVVQAQAAAADGGIAEALVELDRRDAARRRAFARAADRRLPPRAAERLERTRAAYEAGHARLIAVLRALTTRGARPARERADDAALAREATEIVGKLLEASRREPLSAGELKVRPPALSPPSMDTPTAGAAPPVVAATADTPVGPVPQVLRDAAAALSGPVEVYEWVRNNTRPEFYHGAMKGPVETYLEQSGNDADTSSLLIEMLRAKGVPARYVRGV